MNGIAAGLSKEPPSWARRIAVSELVIVEHSGHMVTVEQPDPVNRALVQWLES